jgi:signal transduction histidine kinase
MIILGIGSKMSKKLLLPVKKMTDAVKNISLQNMNTRLNISGSKDELKDLAITFNEMLDRLQDSYEIQNRFVSDASHELRTPIAVIQGYANLLDRWGKEDKAVLDESVTAIKSEAENMKNLIEQLLFLARSDKNTQKIEMSEFQVQEIIDEVIKETKMIDSTHNIINEKNEQLKIVADKNLLKQALRIFIDNSIKYTPEGGNIKLNSYSKGRSLVIEIDDTGIGISKEDLPHIFDRFYRADKSRTKESGGTGLGLSIAKWIILKHKGSVEVQSRPHYGTKICLRIPI